MSTLNQKSAKKLKKGFLEKANATKRIRNLVAFAESESEEEVKQAFSEHHALISCVIGERFAEFESAPKAVRKGKHHAADVLTLFALLKLFVTYTLQENANYVDDVEAWLRKSLGYGNKPPVRLQAFHLLLATVRILHRLRREELKSRFLPLVAASIDLRPFYPDGTRPSLPPVFSDQVLAPELAPPSAEAATEMWAELLEFLGKEGDFQHWFGVLKQLYIPVLFPAISQRLQFEAHECVLPLKDRTFEQCPPPLLCALLDRVVAWLNLPANSPITKTIWTPPHGELLLEFCRQACLLPLEHHSVVHRAVEQYRRTLLEKMRKEDALSQLVGQQVLQEYYRTFLKSLSRVFFLSASAGALEGQVQLARQALAIYQELAVGLAYSIEPQTWVALQEEALALACDLMGSSTPFALNHISTTMAEDLFGVVLLVWIRSPHTTQEMWAELRTKLARLVQWNALLVQWKEKVVQLTYVVRELHYDVEIRAREAQFKAKRQTGGGRGPTIAATTVSVFDTDPNITSVNWERENACRMWRTLLSVLGNLVAIASPENFATAMSCCATVLDLVFSAEDQLQLNVAPALPVYELFVPMLLEACGVEERRNRGRLVAYASLCRIFTRPHMADLARLDLLAHFYRVLKLGLSSGHASLVWSILRNASGLFALGLSGANVLIPDFVRECSRLLKSDGKGSVPADVQQKAIVTLSSLLCYPAHYGDLAYKSGPTPEDYVTFEQLRDKISTTLLLALHNSRLSPDNVALTIHALVVLVLVELIGEKPRKATVRACVKGVLSACSCAVDSVALAALIGLRTLAEAFDRIVAIDKGLVALVMYSLAEYIAARIVSPGGRHPSTADERVPDAPTPLVHSGSTGSSNQERDRDREKEREKERAEADPWQLEQSAPEPSPHAVAVAHFYTLLEWVLATSSPTGAFDLDRSALLEKVFQAVEIGLFGEAVALQRASQQTAFQTAKSGVGSSIGPSSNTAKRRTRFGIDRTASRGGGDDDAAAAAAAAASAAEEAPAADSLLERLASEHPNVASEVREAAELFVMTALARYGNSPLPLGSTDGPPLDPSARESTPVHHFVYNGHTLLSFYALDGSCRVVARDGTGKSTWDCSVLRQSPTTVAEFYTSAAASTAAERDVRRAAAAARASRQPQRPRLPAAAASGSTVDAAGAMLAYLAARQPQHRFSGEDYLREHGEVATAFHNQTAAQARAETDCPHMTTETAPFPLFSTAQEPQSPFHACRLLLSQQGFVRDLQAGSFRMLGGEARLRRSLKELDKINPLETIKIGLIYVRAGQESQKEILHNASASARYVAFVESLGWAVDMNSHAGYRGGLDVRSTGVSSPYYASPLAEVIFHDITRMPTAPDDPQQICKKRHVGNDNVQIVWSEHARDYRPSTITSQFNHAHIVVYPLPNGLHRIQIFKKEEIPTFGPLQDGMVVSKQLLGPLVRQTAINANTASRSTTGVYRKPYHARCDFIAEVVRRHTVVMPLPDVLEALFMEAADPADVDATPQSPSS